MSSLRGQRGWVGLIVLLLALVIAGVLAQTLLKKMGLFSGDRVTTNATGIRGPGPATGVPVDATAATPIPANAIERARGVESTLQQQSQDMSKRIDAQTK